jgi:hypothetical protein
MKQRPKGDKRQIRQEMRLTRPPRMEGKAKEAMMQPKRKTKASRKAAESPHKKQGYTESERKRYQLRSGRGR